MPRKKPSVAPPPDAPVVAAPVAAEVATEPPPAAPGPRPQIEYSHTRIKMSTRKLMEDLQGRLAKGVEVSPAVAAKLAEHRAPDGGYPFCNLVDLGLRLLEQMLDAPASPPPEMAPRKRATRESS